MDHFPDASPERHSDCLRSHSSLVEDVIFPPTSPTMGEAGGRRGCLSSWPSILAGGGHGLKLRKGRRRDWSGLNVASSDSPFPDQHT